MLGGDGLTFEALRKRIDAGARVISTTLTGHGSIEAWRAEHGEDAVPLIAVNPSGGVTVASSGNALEPKAGDTVIGLTG